MRMSWRDVWRDPGHVLAFGFGSGLLPRAPGTWGTVAAIPLYWILSHYNWQVYLLVTIMAFFLGIYVCGRTASILGVHDDARIVWDEIVGYLLTMFLIPAGWFWMAAGFGLFRLFDIWKPQPIRWIDSRVTGGLGIMLDDVLAALFAWIVLELLVMGIHR